MQYARSWKFVFDSPHWLGNLALPIVCAAFIPVVGQFVMLGYFYAVVEALHLSRGQRYEDFAFERFMAYFARGLWPFVIQLILILPLMLVMMLMWGVGVALAAAFVNENNAEVVVPLLIAAGMALYLIVFFAALIVLVPMSLRAGLAQEIALGAAWEFGVDFRRRVQPELMWSLLYNFLMGPVVMLVGALFCCIGMYPAQALLLLSHYHRVSQLYQLYLERGGTEIPLRVEAV